MLVSVVLSSRSNVRDHRKSEISPFGRNDVILMSPLLRFAVLSDIKKYFLIGNFSHRNLALHFIRQRKLFENTSVKSRVQNFACCNLYFFAVSFTHF